MSDKYSLTKNEWELSRKVPVAGATFNMSLILLTLDVFVLCTLVCTDYRVLVQRVSWMYGVFGIQVYAVLQMYEYMYSSLQYTSTVIDKFVHIKESQSPSLSRGSVA